MLTKLEREKCGARPNAIDYDRVAGLHYLGNYVRRLPSNMARMMENAYDWEHLPYVHPSSFASIDLVESGKWGWRARIGVPGGLEPVYQMLDLLVDSERNYWVSTVFNGPGEGIEIHTQATTLNDEEIQVDVRFYVPEAPGDEAASAAILAYMQSQYATLYDEDIDLMQGRQSALEDRARWRSVDGAETMIKVGSEATMERTRTYSVETETGRYCIRWFDGAWIVHNAVCPHQLGPLHESQVDAEGRVTCPWHGYQFDIRTGESLTGDCPALGPAPDLIERDGALFLVAPATE